MHRPLILESAPGAEVVIDGRRCLYFGGTSYLGLAGDPEVIEAACHATRRYGVHAATSRAGYGNSPPTLEVERLAAQFFGTEDAFYFVSGYVGNHILVQVMSGCFDAVLIDEAAHYCVSEAAKLIGLPIISFRHRDAADLRSCLNRDLRPGQRPLVMTDGVFAMTGALAPITDYIQTLERHAPAAILVDDAHALGVLGENGRGSFEQAGLWGPEVNAATPSQGVELYVCGTMSKAMGGFGGIIPGCSEFVNRARSSSHYFDGASAPPSAAAGATAKALELVLREPRLRQRLLENIRRMRGGLSKLGLDVENWPTPNIGLQIGDATNMRRIHEELMARGILVPYIASYSGTGKEGLLRIAVFATHTAEMIDRVLAVMSELL